MQNRYKPEKETDERMIKKYAAVMLLLYLLFTSAFLNEKGMDFIRTLGRINEAERNLREDEVVETCKIVYESEVISGNQPLLTMQSVARTQELVLSEEDKLILYKIVEAEAGCEDYIGKILVANVVLNRLQDSHFPNTVEEVVFQQEDGVTQFSPVANGRYDAAVPDEDTIQAVEAALGGEDYSEGALYFVARQYADSANLKWFDDSLEKVVIHGGHEFYK